ncbi:MAG: hypothetical protein ACLQDM_13100, partial [Bradyrhizobium sp.]
MAEAAEVVLSVIPGARKARARNLEIPGSSLSRCPGMTAYTNKKQNRRGNPMAYETIKYEVAEQILTITLNRPDKL